MKPIFFIPTILLVISGLIQAAPSSETFINGGSVTLPGQYPYLAAIYASGNGDKFCQGALLNTEYVLTAAKCVYGFTEFEIVLGAYRPEETESGQVRLTRSIADVTIHERFVPGTAGYDIAIIDLGVSVRISDTIKPAPLMANNTSSDFATQEGTVIGWDRQKLLVMAYTNTIVRNPQCYFQVLASNICLAADSGANGPLNDDAGAPLISDLNGENVLVGIMAYTSIYGPQDGKPFVFSRISEFIKWIETNSNVKFPGPAQPAPVSSQRRGCENV